LNLIVWVKRLGLDQWQFPDPLFGFPVRHAGLCRREIALWRYNLTADRPVTVTAMPRKPNTDEAKRRSNGTDAASTVTFWRVAFLFSMVYKEKA